MTALRVAELAAERSRSYVATRPALYVVGSESDPHRIARERAEQRRQDLALAQAREERLIMVKSWSVKAVFVLAAISLSIFAGLLVGSLFTPSAVASDVYQVVQGDTLWDIASRVRGSYSVTDMMALIQELNQLPNSGVVAGQVLLIPAG
ncbi:LysM peptidoglycan-binding domain-containing protein [Boudabousia marimammalium]|uniref:LysM domain-containing protein n=1 Tax=Boudabousia marimammalium TaxID=156892 RepID=A0A1Q5PPC9_9ACTO|nr:LysM peptidoglycan-binding domain-containing protein [Boudabousia marimammalium]OKL49255.1 hypothetical protein BM477_04510 [Boudabousia marimammalium]